MSLLSLLLVPSLLAAPVPEGPSKAALKDL